MTGFGVFLAGAAFTVAAVVLSLLIVSREREPRWALIAVGPCIVAAVILILAGGEMMLDGL